MSDLRYLLSVARRMTLLEWLHGAACMAVIGAWTWFALIGGLA